MRQPALVLIVLLGGCALSSCATRYYPVPPPPRPDAVSLDVSYFYDQLTPYGDWVETPAYGWVWSPRGIGAEWRPYTLGHWVYSDDDGWLWVSDEEWGWAAYHYGRWYPDARRWFWVPGRDWAPAWVAWRSGGGFIGWAPLPPRAEFVVGLGLRIAADVLEAALEPREYCFVDERHFTEDRIVTRVVPVVRNVTIVNMTRNITNYTVVQNRVVSRSIAVEAVEHAVGHAVPRARIVETSSLSGPHRAQVQGNEVTIFRPPIHPADPERKPASARARTPVSGPEADRAKLDQKQAREKASLEARHAKEIQNPPKGVPIAQVKARHENEHQALEQKHAQENHQAASRQQSHQETKTKKKPD